MRSADVDSVDSTRALTHTHADPVSRLLHLAYAYLKAVLLPHSREVVCYLLESVQQGTGRIQSSSRRTDYTNNTLILSSFFLVLFCGTRSIKAWGVRMCVCACVRACVRACVCVCV